MQGAEGLSQYVQQERRHQRRLVVSDQLLLGLCVGLKSPEIEEVAIEAIADINAIIVIEVFSSLSQHHAEEDGEESRCQNAALFHAVADCERIGEVTVEPDLATLVVM